MIKDNLLKVILVFVMGGVLAVLGLVPGTENLSNFLGGQISNVKTAIGTAASPTTVQ
jgi:hypothetical protein